MQLHTKIVIGMAAGTAVGLVANLGDVGWLKTALVSCEPLGTAFIRAITMTVIPLVVSSLLVGATSLGDIRKLGRIGLRTSAFFLFTTAVAISLGLLGAFLIKPGAGIDEATRASLSSQFSQEAASKMQYAEQAPKITDMFLSMIPRNPVSAAANFEMLALIVFVVVFAAALSTLPRQKSAPVIGFFDAVNEASMKVIGWVMQIAPYAVFTLIAGVVSRFGMGLLQSLLLYTLVVLGGLLIHTYGTLALATKLFARISPREFFRRIRDVQLVAFSTSSSNATLPLSLKTAEESLGVSNSIASFVLPLGATINMNGTALYQAVAVVFIGQIYGLEFGLLQILTILLTATLASIGTAGVPSAGIVMVIIVLQSVGLGGHVEAGISLILGVDRILDMARTTSNVTGDLVCCAYVGRVEGEMDLPVKEAATIS